MNINAFAVNERAEVDGIWKDLGGGAAILVARAGNTNYKNKLRTLMTPYQGALGIVPMTDDEATKIMAEALVGTVLLDWKNLSDTVDGEDVVVEYTPETALEWLLKYKEFKKIVQIVAEDIENFKQAAEVAAFDNLVK